MNEGAVQGLTDFEKQLIHTAFHKQINLAPREIDRLVGVDPSAAPALEGAVSAPSPRESLAELELLTEEQRIARRLVCIRRAKREELTDDDYRAMREAVNFIRRSAERPPKDADDLSEWRAALMARGFDPNKTDKTHSASGEPI